MVAEAVEEGCGELLVAKDFDPLGEGEVRGDDGRAALVAIGEQVEEKLAALSIEGHEAELVADEQVDSTIASLQSAKVAFVSRLEQVTDEVCGADEGNALSTTRRLDANSRGEHRFASADGAGDDDVLPRAEEFTGRQLDDLGFGDALERTPVKLVEGFDLGKVSLANTAVRGRVATAEDLELKQVDEEVAVLPLGVVRLPHKALVLSDDPRQLEFTAMLGEHSKFGRVHEAPPSRWSKSLTLALSTS